MAFTVAKIHEDVHGSSRFQVLSCTADAATQAIDTGLDYVYGVSFAEQSMSSGNFSIRANQGAAGTAVVGTIAVTGVTSGDVFYLSVWGR
jgi:hypothetical protein